MASPALPGRLLQRTALLLTTAAALAVGASAEVAPAGKTKGFVLSTMIAAAYAGADDCPDGLTLDAIPAYLATLSEAEQARITQPQNAGELNIKASGDAQKDACTYPTLFKRPPVKAVQGKTGYGLNLDGEESANDFVSPTGERGIDNQMYRATGCTKRFRPGGAIGASKDRASVGDEATIASLRGGEMTILLEVTGIDSERDDAEVMIGVYGGVDPAVTDSQGNVVADTTQRVTENRKWHSRARGRIEAGVIISEPFDLRLKHKSAISYTEMFVRGAQLRLAFQPDGSVKGMLGGYRDIETLYGGVPRAYGRALELGGSFDCPSYYTALYEYADGPVNADTGKRDSISAAWDIEAVPAFVIHDAKLAARPVNQPANQPENPATKQ